MRNSILKIRNYLIIILLACLMFAIYTPLTANAAKWPGVDVNVVQKIASEHGRKASSPLINTDQGDLLLFVFLLAGTVGGFIAGYSWRMLTSKEDK
jgi:ABC-type cobalt transport system substrate-binding protein